MNAILEQRKSQVITEITRLENAQLLELIERLLAFARPKTAPSPITDAEVSSAEIAQLLDSSRAFTFLASEEEDIYSDADLKVTY